MRQESGSGFNPDPWENLESRTPNMVPYTTIGYFLGTLKGDLLSRSAQGSGKWLFFKVVNPL